MVLTRSLSPFAVLLSSSIAQAVPPGLGLDSRCAPAETSVEEVMQILAAEFAPMHIEPVDGEERANDDSGIRVVIDDCAELPPGARVAVWFRGRPIERFVDLGDAASDARSRTLALAIAEMIRDDPALAAGVTSEVVAPPRPPEAPSVASAKEDLPPEPAPRDHPSAAALIPRASAVIRFVPSPATVLVGGEAGFAWGRFGASILCLITEREASLGTAHLSVVAASVSVDALRFGERAAFRAVGELGAAIATGSASEGATEQSGVAPHAAVGGGWWAAAALGSGWMIEGYAGAGYASSITARVDGSDTLASSGVFVSAELGVRFP